MTPNQTQGIGQQKYHTFLHCSTLSPKFSFCSTISRFFEIFRILGFPLSPMLVCHTIFKTWLIPKKNNSLYSIMVAQCPHKVWLTSDENCGRSSILKCPAAPYGPVFTKISKCHKIFNFSQITKKVISYISPRL